MIVNLVANTIRVVRTDEQRERFLPLFRGVGQLCCQLFPEPDVESDLAGLSTQVIREGDHWVR